MHQKATSEIAEIEVKIIIGHDNKEINDCPVDRNSLHQGVLVDSRVTMSQHWPLCPRRPMAS